MKKVVLASGLKALFAEKGSFLDRADIEVFTAATNDELMSIHQNAHADLIVTKIDLPGARTEDLFSAIRNDDDRRSHQKDPLVIPFRAFMPHIPGLST